MLLLTILAVSTAILSTVVATPPCAPSGPRPRSICLEYMTPFKDNAYFWTLVTGITPANQSVLTGMNGEFWDAGDGCSSPSTYYATCCAQYNGGVYVDCEGPETGLPPTQNGSVAIGWHTYMACAVDTPPRVLAGVVSTTNPAYATSAGCTDHCQSLGPNYHYAGVEYGTECHCGTGLAGGVAPAAADVSECDMRCAGDFIFLCGGSWRIQLYTNLNP